MVFLNVLSVMMDSIKKTMVDAILVMKSVTDVLVQALHVLLVQATMF